MTNLTEIKNQLNLAIRSDKMTIEHLKKAFELVADLEQVSQPATPQGSTVRIIPNRLSREELALNNRPAKTERHITKREKVLASLSKRAYAISGKTIVEETGITAGALSQHLNELRKRGYKIDCYRTGSNAGKYKLVKRA